MTGGVLHGDFRPTPEVAEREAHEASMPPITAKQAAIIRGLLEEEKLDEAKLLAYMRASSIEEIRDFEKAVGIITHPITRASRDLADLARDFD